MMHWNCLINKAKEFVEGIRKYLKEFFNKQTGEEAHTQLGRAENFVKEAERVQEKMITEGKA